MTWSSERAGQIVDEAIYNFLYGDEDEKRRQFKEHFMIAAERAVREAIEAALEVHVPGCPTTHDDEGDQVLYDYQQCCCDAEELRVEIRRTLLESHGE
jgi:hypothetical protein